ncbi:hypothetical protein, partial [Nocardioides sp.]|uniref:hypothetical protein n=1 Tax=Nocardioides sp. TaxID=35761 RepID=UPI002736B33F
MSSPRVFLRIPLLPLALAGALIAALLPLGPSGPATAGALASTHPSVAGLLASPVTGATTTPRRASKARLALRATRDGRRGGSAMKIRTRAHRPVTIPGRHRPAHRTPRGTGHTLRAWVRATAPGQRATLVGRELLDGSSLQKQSRSKKLRRGSWVRIDVPVRTRHHRSTFGIQLKVSSRRPGKGKVKVDDVVVVIPPEAETCRVNPRGVPSCGAYLGMTYGSNTEPSEAEAEFGGTVAVRRTFFRHDNTEKAITVARGDLEKGRLPWMSFKMPHSWDRMAAGDGDAWT